ncbi:DUF1080 domain-containing protein [Arcticibacter sp.]|uniref:3-keto-disaccharide hydrolase n=1 Tax=Arcticibacter sp. TaxID=1872630 RepID=UPI00388D7F14
MNALSFSALSLMTIFGCSNADSSRQADESWQVLFDGKSLDGWHAYGKPHPGTAWVVEDSVLYLDASAKKAGASGGDLVTNQEYENFHLQLEWKISVNGNSGVIFYINEDADKYPETYSTGLEMQVLDNDGHPDGKIHKHRAGDLYDLIPCTRETVNPPGKWNKVDIISNKGHLELHLNGTKVVETTLWDADWKNLVSKSKFASMPGFSAFKKGRIALQDHGDDVWYRNIRIRKL